MRSAKLAIRAVVKISHIAGLTRFSLGFAIVAVSTSLPEMTVAPYAVSSGNLAIALGDIVGSNVTNLAPIAPPFLLPSPVRRIEPPTMRGLPPALLVASPLPLLLLAAFGFFVYLAFRSSPRAEERARGTGSPRWALTSIYGVAVIP